MKLNLIDHNPVNNNFSIREIIEYEDAEGNTVEGSFHRRTVNSNRDYSQDYPEVKSLIDMFPYKDTEVLPDGIHSKTTEVRIDPESGLMRVRKELHVVENGQVIDVIRRQDDRWAEPDDLDDEDPDVDKVKKIIHTKEKKDKWKENRPKKAK